LDLLPRFSYYHHRGGGTNNFKKVILLHKYILDGEIIFAIAEETRDQIEQESRCEEDEEVVPGIEEFDEDECEDNAEGPQTDGLSFSDRMAATVCQWWCDSGDDILAVTVFEVSYFFLNDEQAPTSIYSNQCHVLACFSLFIFLFTSS